MRKDTGAELKTVELMIRLYCRGNHGGREGLCAECGELLAYAARRLDKCPYRPKPSCRNCPAHCYTPENRARIKEVMRYAAPRMLLRRPLLALKHFLEK